MLIDGIAKDTAFAGLAAGVTVEVDDVVHVLGAGARSVRLIVDYGNQVSPELNDNDNEWDSVFTWAQAQITATGDTWYWQLNGEPWPPGDVAVEFRIELWDADPTGPGTKLFDTITNIDGEFELGPVSNVDADGTRRDIYIRLYAENSAARVGDNDSLVYFFSGDTVSDVLSGEYVWGGGFGFPLMVDTGHGGFFYVADVIRELRGHWAGIRPDKPLDQLQVLLYDNSPYGTAYASVGDVMFVEKLKKSTGPFPDTWDRDPIAHEFGHRLQFEHDYFTDTVGPPAHYPNTVFSLGFAATEAFGYLWAAVSKNLHFIYDSWNDFKDTLWVNVENLQYGVKTDTGGYRVDGTANSMGDACEGSVAGVLWDIYDNVDDDFSSASNWGSVTLPHTSDGIKDSLSDGIDNILSALLDRNVNGHHPDNISEFWEAWFQQPAFDHFQAMHDIWYEHGIDEDCCVGIRGNVDGDPYENIDISDVGYLVDYAF